jgi:hypothetical protein
MVMTTKANVRANAQQAERTIRRLRCRFSLVPKMFADLALGSATMLPQLPMLFSKPMLLSKSA